MGSRLTPSPRSGSNPRVRTSLVAIVALALAAAACGDDDNGVECMFNLTAGVGVAPEYTFDGPLLSLNVVRDLSPNDIVWGVATPGMDGLMSPLVHGDVPMGAIQTPDFEVTLSLGIEYRVIAAKTR